MYENEIENLNKKLGKFSSFFELRIENQIVIATYMPYGLEFIYVPSGKYNKGLSEKERFQAKMINENIVFQKDELEFEEGVYVQEMLVTRTPILNEFISKFIPHDFFPGEEKYGAYMGKETIDLLCGKLNLRIPTETECEYLIRAGSNDLFSFGMQLPDDNELDRWLNLDFSDLQVLNCNRFGLYGIYIGEWCSDMYRKNKKCEFEDAYVVKGGGAYFWPWQGDEWIWCMSAMRMPSSGLIDGECGARLIFDLN